MQPGPVSWANNTRILQLDLVSVSQDHVVSPDCEIEADMTQFPSPEQQETGRGVEGVTARFFN